MPSNLRPQDKCPFTASHSLKSQRYVEQIRGQISGKRKFLFLDRDGVINHDPEGYVKNLFEFRFIDGAIDAIAKAYQAGWIVNVCTTQPAISEGLMSHSDLDEIHQVLRRTVEDVEGLIAEIYYCPHLYEVRCPYRKRNPGQLFDISRKFSLSRSECRGTWLIGDNLRDLFAGYAFGCNVALVKTGYGSTLLAEGKVPLFAKVFRDLGEAVHFILHGTLE